LQRDRLRLRDRSERRGIEQDALFERFEQQSAIVTLLGAGAKPRSLRRSIPAEKSRRPDVTNVSVGLYDLAFLFPHSSLSLTLSLGFMSAKLQISDTALFLRIRGLRD
jgi:hypothetical protein